MADVHALIVSMLLHAEPLTVLYPRIIPRSEADKSLELATGLQMRLVDLAHKAFPGRELDVRPKGERSCPEAGCKGGSLNVLLLRSGSDGCALVVLTGKPGRGAIHLTPWIGKLELKKTDVDFREPPESQVTINDYLPCEQVYKASETPSADAERALRDSAR